MKCARTNRKAASPTQRANLFDQNNEIADVNGDGKNELIFSEVFGGNYLMVYKNTRTDTWSLMGEYAPVE